MAFKKPTWLNWPSRPRQPEVFIKPRTGDARYVPTMASYGAGKGGTVVQQANRIDDVTIRDLDRARMYPIVKDCLNTLITPMLTAQFSFESDRQEIADLAMQELGPLVHAMLENTVKPGMEFGWGNVWPHWEPKFDVTLSLGQSASGQGEERYYPFVWTIDDIYCFSPKDTRNLINTATGKFGGVRQQISPRFPTAHNILAHEILHFVNNPEFDGTYGVADTKPAIPFIEAAESVFDSMVLASDKFADPIKTIYYPAGSTPIGKDSNGNAIKIPNVDLAMQIAESAQGGTTQALPSDPWPNSSARRWELTFEDPGTGTDPYTPRINLLNDMIRIAIAVPQVASSDTVDAGTYNLGTAQIDLLRDNLQAKLNAFETAYNKQIMNGRKSGFVLYNFGADAPECFLRFRPLDFDTAKMVLQMLLNKMQQGEPIAETSEGIVVPDMAKYAKDAGLATMTIKKSDAQKVADVIADRLSQHVIPNNGQTPSSTASGGRDNNRGER